MWSSAPDQELLDLAAEGTLKDQQVLKNKVQSMLNDPRATDAIAKFGADWAAARNVQGVDFPVVDGVSKYPDFNEELKAEMQAETETLFRNLYASNASWEDIYASKEVTVGPRLAELYGLDDVKDDVATYDVSDKAERRGLVANASVLTAVPFGHADSSVFLGLNIMRNYLCDDSIPQPDAATLAQIEELKSEIPENATERWKVEFRANQAGCGDCHGSFDPLSLVLEPYDGIGRFRTKDQWDQELFANGEVDIDADGQTVTYDNLQDYVEILTGSERVRNCVAEKTLQFSLGRNLGRERCFEKQVQETLAGGGSLKDAFATVALSPRFQFSKTAAGEAEE